MNENYLLLIYKNWQSLSLISELIKGERCNLSVYYVVKHLGTSIPLKDYYHLTKVYRFIRWISILMCKLTFAAVTVGISRVTSIIAMTSHFITWRSIQTSSTTIVRAVISEGSVITPYNTFYLVIKSNP